MSSVRFPLLLTVALLVGASARASEASLVALRAAVLLDGATAHLATPLRPGQVITTGPTSWATPRA